MGRFLAEGWHQVKIGAGGGGVGILVLPKDCAIVRPEPGEPLCFAHDGARRRRCWHTTEAKMGALACHGSDLAISRERHSSIGSGGTIYTKFFVTNESDRACTVAGVPDAVALGHRRRPVGVGGSKPLLRPGSRGGRLRVSVDPGRSATFFVAYYDGIGAGRCRFASTRSLRLRIPGTAPRRTVPYGARYCPAQGAGLGLRVGRIE